MTTASEHVPEGTELLDSPGADPASVAVSLNHIARSNRWFGGRAAVRYGLERLVDRGSPQWLSLLDVGAGCGDLSVEAARWAARSGVTVRAIGLDWNPTAAGLARARGTLAVRASGIDLPFPRKSVDLVLVSQVLHHLGDREAIRLLRECDRVARRGVILTDLRRSALAAWGFALASVMLRFDANTRADGVTSIRRGYTRERLDRLLAAAEIRAVVSWRPLARFVAIWVPS